MPKTAAPKKPFDLDASIGGLVFAMRGPLIVYETTWAESIPDWIRSEITTARLIQQMQFHKGASKTDLATDLETVAYLFPASMIAPMSHDWAEIYLWLSAKCMRESMIKKTSPATIKAMDEIAPKSLNGDQERQLKDLQRWLYRRYEAAKASFRRMARNTDTHAIVVEPYAQCNLWEEKPEAKKSRKEKVHA